jgi:hypothetical protein
MIIRIVKGPRSSWRRPPSGLDNTLDARPGQPCPSTGLAVPHPSDWQQSKNPGR